MEKILDRLDISEAVRALATGVICSLIALIIFRIKIDEQLASLTFLRSIPLLLFALMGGWISNTMTEWGFGQYLYDKAFRDGRRCGSIQSTIVDRFQKPFIFRWLTLWIFWVPGIRCRKVYSEAQFGIFGRIGGGALSGYFESAGPFERVSVFISIYSDEISKTHSLLLAELNRAHDRLVLTVSSSVFACVLGAIGLGTHLLNDAQVVDLNMTIAVLFIFFGIATKFVARSFWEREIVLLAAMLERLKPNDDELCA